MRKYNLFLTNRNDEALRNSTIHEVYLFCGFRKTNICVLGRNFLFRGSRSVLCSDNRDRVSVFPDYRDPKWLFLDCLDQNFQILRTNEMRENKRNVRDRLTVMRERNDEANLLSRRKLLLV